MYIPGVRGDLREGHMLTTRDWHVNDKPTDKN